MSIVSTRTLEPNPDFIISSEQLLTLDYIVEKLLSKHLGQYVKQHAVFKIENRKEHIVSDLSEIGEDTFLKIEKVETYSRKLNEIIKDILIEHNHFIPHDYTAKPIPTVHLFVGNEKQASFPPHRDPMDVVMLQLQGSKLVITDQRPITLSSGIGLYIPAATEHEVIHMQPNTMLSIGLEDWREHCHDF